jgi:hypothetical protein
VVSLSEITTDWFRNTVERFVPIVETCFVWGSESIDNLVLLDWTFNAA